MGELLFLPKGDLFLIREVSFPPKIEQIYLDIGKYFFPFKFKKIFEIPGLTVVYPYMCPPNPPEAKKENNN